MVKRSKIPKLKVPSLGGLTKNKYVLYLLVVVGLVNVVTFLQTNNLDSLGLFVISGVLTTFFTKNMIVALSVAILAGMCKTCTKYIAVGKYLEGFKEGADDDEELEDDEEEEDDGMEEFVGGYFREGFKEGNKNKMAGKKKKKASNKKTADNEWYSSTGKKSGCKKVGKKKCKDKNWTCQASKKACQDASKKGFQNQHSIPSSEPTSLDDNGDEAPGKRIDYAATMEMAYDNLDKMLGKDGMKGLTAETSKLAAQQKGLMESLKNMTPIMNSAKNTLESMNLPEINKMAQMMKNINGGKRAK